MTVKAELPAGVAVVVDTVRVDEPGAPIEVGLRLAVAPVGKPLIRNATVPLNPFSAAVEIV